MLSNVHDKDYRVLDLVRQREIRVCQLEMFLYYLNILFNVLIMQNDNIFYY